jgi:hypothetical protein
MMDIKSWLQSRTIWAALVALAPVATKLLGFDVSATLNDILTIAGIAGVIYFRIKATSKLQ